MVNNLLSIDWDYFIPIKREWCGSYIENNKNKVILWYKRYIEYKRRGYDLQTLIKVDSRVNYFWKNIKRYFIFNKNTKVFVSDSHKFSYSIAKKNKCLNVYNFDAHSDLGYGGLKSLNFELNCGNWLGKLLKDNIIKGANIIYSPYTYESKEEFEEINNTYNVEYLELKDINKIPISFIHICRSGTWTPPWLDDKFEKFVNQSNLFYKTIDYFKRKWNPKDLSLSTRIYFMYC
ncbi:hypothetical protein CLOACE_20010 [Clostridium acetireducens DSM 10703]|uniref:Arginase n=1 Tax=Clostridium acetireducens DSM 10703 TaxID=1121290 RepID=A0A1E8EWH1_9CLOT|nr:arginase [Clostridium acetireducens]OFI04985.1 hypothetical protein CLOACE_20010 [Clostridium acetireducens DSM 10703]